MCTTESVVDTPLEKDPVPTRPELYQLSHICSLRVSQKLLGLFQFGANCELHIAAETQANDKLVYTAHLLLPAESTAGLLATFSPRFSSLLYSCVGCMWCGMAHLLLGTVSGKLPFQ